MSGDAATELREEIAGAICPGIYCESHSECLDDADAVLALPSVRRLLADRQAVQRVADELEGWRDNAQRYADGAVMGSTYERSLGRVRAYERAIEGIRRALGGAS